ncbi:hypothetical protein HJFPF1_11966 [Paramyrothecium foliicola]|nr:hypothetical protein HJFPF1_11966 [Paramyrothecium foliicola]
MSAVLNSLEESVNEFFAAHETITKQQCDELAASLIGGTISPVPVQGCSSYTVMSDADTSKLVQFRDVKADLDTGMVDLASSIHGKQVPSYSSHGRIGHRQKLAVYSMDKIPGITYIPARFQNQDTESKTCQIDEQLSKTVIDLALFYATSWKAQQELDSEVVDAMRLDYEARIDILSRVLPSRHQQNLDDVLDGLELLFDDTYPMVLNHGNVSELNMIVDPSTGGINGIVGWTAAHVSPFGMSLWTLENILGSMDETGWHYHDRHMELRTQFWRTFEEAVGGLSDCEKQAIEVARMAGLFIRYGFDWKYDDLEPSLQKMWHLKLALIRTSLTLTHEIPTSRHLGLAGLGVRELNQVKVGNTALLSGLNIPIGLENPPPLAIEPVHDLDIV